VKDDYIIRPQYPSYSHGTPSLKLTANAPENGWLEYGCFVSFWGRFLAYFHGPKVKFYVGSGVDRSYLFHDFPSSLFLETSWSYDFPFQQQPSDAR